jgi:hypothetical protein
MEKVFLAEKSLLKTLTKIHRSLNSLRKKTTKKIRAFYKPYGRYYFIKNSNNNFEIIELINDYDNNNNNNNNKSINTTAKKNAKSKNKKNKNKNNLKLFLSIFPKNLQMFFKSLIEHHSIENIHDALNSIVANNVNTEKKNAEKLDL